MDSRRTSIDRSATSAGTAIASSARWFGTAGSWANHHRVRPVSSAARPGIGRDSTWSNALTRSFATSRSRSSRPSGAYRSRTLPGGDEVEPGQLRAHAIPSAMSVRRCAPGNRIRSDPLVRGGAGRGDVARRAPTTVSTRPPVATTSAPSNAVAAWSTCTASSASARVEAGDRRAELGLAPGSRRSRARPRRPRRRGTPAPAPGQRADRRAVQQRGQRGGEPGQHDLGLRVAEPRVELDDLHGPAPSTTSPQ